MKRLYLSMDDRLFEAIIRLAEEKGIPPTSLVIGNLEDLYLKEEAIDYDAVLNSICNEAKQMPTNVPFLLADLPSFNELIISTAEKAHISPSPVRARIGKSFNAAVKAGKVENVLRAKRENGKLLNKAGVAMYIKTNS